MTAKYRVGGVRITAVPTVGQTFTLQYGPMADGSFSAVNVVFASAPGSIAAAAAIAVAAINTVVPSYFKVATFGDGIIEHLTFDSSPTFALSYSGTVPVVQRSERYAEVPEGALPERYVAVEKEVTNVPALAIAAVGGLMLGKSIRPEGA